MECFEIKENEYFIKADCDLDSEDFAREFQAVKGSCVRQYAPVIARKYLVSKLQFIISLSLLFIAGLIPLIIGLIIREYLFLAYVSLFTFVILLVLIPLMIWGYKTNRRFFETAEVFPAEITEATKKSYVNKGGDVKSYDTDYLFLYKVLTPLEKYVHKHKMYTAISFDYRDLYGKEFFHDLYSKEALFFQTYADQKYFFVLLKNKKRSVPVRLLVAQADEKTANAADKK